MTKIMVGIDIGFRHSGLVAAQPKKTGVGYNIIASACFHTQKSNKKRGILVAHDDVRSVREMIRNINKFIIKYSAAALAVELPQGGAKGARAHRTMGMASAMIAAYAELIEVPAIWFDPLDVKFAVCGRKNAGKEEVQAAVAAHFPSVAWPSKKKDWEHIADAAATLMAAIGSDIYNLLRGA